MKFSFNVLILPALLLLLNVSCASKPYFDRGALSAQAGIAKPVFDDNKDIQKEFARKKNLPKPFKVAVYFRTPALDKGGASLWRWTDEDKAFIDQMTQDLQKQGVVSQVSPLFSTLVADESLASLRLAAARYQADALLVIGGATQVERSFKDAAWTYFFILPTLFVQATDAQSLFVTTAALWDVRNEYLYLAAETEGWVEKSYAPAFGFSDKELIKESKKLSLEKMKEALKKAIEGSKN